MLRQTEATYFDGLSSNPNIVVVGFNENFTLLIFQSPEIPKTEWALKDIIPDLSGNKTTIRHLFDKEKILTIDNAAFSKLFFEHFRKTGNRGIYHRLLNAGHIFVLSLLVFLIVVIISGYFYFIPWLSERAVAMIPISYDESLGKKIFENIIANEISLTKLSPR